ncbi:MAG: ferrous iron transporter B, partial [Thermodesulfobacteriota bacterium]|nr:ferrous iron transporter B [Thermodesulfobacteriota bacterium]
VIGGLLHDGSAIHGLVIDGIISGAGSVLVFVPIIFILFFSIAILEDSGYMARAAFIMDRFMQKIGLHGKSFIPMILGFGCNVPAIMATRTIETKRDRFATILVTPFMSCGARLPIYALFIGIFFPERSGTVLFLLYIIGIMMAILMAKFFRKYLFTGEVSPFIMELPPYRIPTIKGAVIHMWERGKLYLKKAGTIIFTGCVIVWFISNFPWTPEYSKDYDSLIENAESGFAHKIRLIESGFGAKKKELATNEKFIKFRDVDRAFIKKTAELKAEDNEYLMAEEERERKFALLKKGYPELYDLYFQYVKAKALYDDNLSRLKNEKTSEKLEKSYAGKLGRIIEPIIKPLGFDWKIGVGLSGGFIAKEIVVGTLGTLYAVGKAGETSESLKKSIKNDTWPDGSKIYTPLVAFTLMVFCLLYVPCIAAIGVIYREMNSFKWTAFAAFYTTTLAWIVCFIIFQGGRLIGLG